MNHSARQSGAALAVALILLVVITLLGITAMRSTTMELTMAGNQQMRMEAIERTQSIIDGAFSKTSNFVVTGGAGYTNCTANVPATECDEQAVALPSEPIFSSTVTTAITAKIERQDPPVIAAPRGLGSSITAFDAVPFSVEAKYDETSLGAGRAEVVQGVIILVPKGAH